MAAFMFGQYHSFDGNLAQSFFSAELTEPFVINTESITNGKTFSPWIFDYTNQNTMMISSDKILTIVEPNETLLQKYEDLTKK